MPAMQDTRRILISQSSNQNDIDEVVKLFRAYAESLGIDLTFQGFEEEMSSMPGKYAAPNGTLLLARHPQGFPIGCVGLRSLQNNTICEMKRLFVAPAGRGMGAGKALAQAVIAEARKLGYSRMRLDTLSSMTAALQLYKSLRFVEIDAYYNTPLTDTVFLELIL